MPDYMVSVSFGGRDAGINWMFKQMADGADRFGDAASRNFSKASKGSSGFMDSFKGNLAANVFSKGLGIISSTLGSTVSEFIDADDAIFGATARFKYAEAAGTDMTKVMEDLRVAAQKVGDATQYTAAQTAKGLEKFALSGFTSSEAIGSLQSEVDLATVSSSDFFDVVQISTDLLGSFGGAALKGGEKIKFLQEMNALLAVGTLSANVSMEDLFQTLKVAAPVGDTLGMTMKDMIATTSVLGSAGIKGEQAATAMKNIFLRLAAPTAMVTGALNDLNLTQRDFVDSNGKMKQTADIFSIIGEKTKGMESVKVAALFSALAGMEGIAGASVLSKNIDRIRNQMVLMGKDPQKAMEEAAVFMRQSLGNRLEDLSSSAAGLGVKFLKVFRDEGAEGITAMSKAIQTIDPSEFISALQIVFSFIKGIFNFVSPLVSLLPSLVKAWAAYKFYLIASYAATKAIIALEWIKYLWMMRDVIMKAAAAQNAWNIAMTMNPIGIIITALVALAGGIKYIYDNFGMLTVQWEFGWNVFLAKISLAEYRIYEFLTAIPLIGQSFEQNFALAKMNLMQTDEAAQSALAKLKEVEGSYKEKKFLGMFSGKIGENISTPPNTAEAMSRNNVNVSGTIGVSGPPGTTVQKDKKASPGWDMGLLGAN